MHVVVNHVLGEIKRVFEEIQQKGEKRESGRSADSRT